VIGRVIALFLAAIAGAWSAAFAQIPAPPPLRLAIAGLPPGPCAPPPAGAAGLSAYAAHLSARLQRPVLACPTADTAKAGELLAAGGADLALLDPAGFAMTLGKARVILAPRNPSDHGRIEIIFAAHATSQRTGAAGLSGARLALGGDAPIAAILPVRVAEEAGVARAAFRAIAPGSAVEDAAAALRAGRADVAAFHAAAWRRLCRADAPGQEPCKDLKVVYRARPQAKLAFVAPLSMSDETRYRLIGIHIAMHLEAPAAFAFVRTLAPEAESVDPAEASALATRPGAP
jgi:ABC-type phosphate/phosphonate transport system substrate-binding protein